MPEYKNAWAELPKPHLYLIQHMEGDSDFSLALFAIDDNSAVKMWLDYFKDHEFTAPDYLFRSRTIQHERPGALIWHEDMCRRVDGEYLET